jgi:hypothetical protein
MVDMFMCINMQLTPWWLINSNVWSYPNENGLIILCEWISPWLLHSLFSFVIFKVMSKSFLFEWVKKLSPIVENPYCPNKFFCNMSLYSNVSHVYNAKLKMLFIANHNYYKSPCCKVSFKFFFCLKMWHVCLCRLSRIYISSDE